MPMKKIIHVDNSEFFQKLTKTFLEGEKFEVESFDDPQEASLAIAGGLADMVIMGLTFAGVDGEEFAAKTIESFSGPVIVLSSSVSKEKTEKLTGLGVRAVLGKSGPWKEEIKPFLASLGAGK